jgi:hypothetical protein
MGNLTKSLLVLLLLIFANPSVSDARIFGRRRSYSYSGVYGEYKSTKFSTEKRYDFDGKKFSLQDIAQLRAEAMAKHQVLTHGIHSFAKVPAAPIAEGIGVSGASDYKNVGTCICGSTVVADGWCKSKSGSIYRVRFWR